MPLRLFDYSGDDRNYSPGRFGPSLLGTFGLLKTTRPWRILLFVLFAINVGANKGRRIIYISVRSDRPNAEPRSVNPRRWVRRVEYNDITLTPYRSEMNFIFLFIYFNLPPFSPAVRTILPPGDPASFPPVHRSSIAVATIQSPQSY